MAKENYKKLFKADMTQEEAEELARRPPEQKLEELIKETRLKLIEMEEFIDKIKSNDEIEDRTYDILKTYMDWLKLTMEMAERFRHELHGS
jgi:hypothetical protein